MVNDVESPRVAADREGPGLGGVKDVAGPDPGLGQDAAQGRDGVVVMGEVLLARAGPMGAVVRLVADAERPGGDRVAAEGLNHGLDGGLDVAAPDPLVRRGRGVAVDAFPRLVAHSLGHFVEDDDRFAAGLDDSPEFGDHAAEVGLNFAAGTDAAEPIGMESPHAAKKTAVGDLGHEWVLFTHGLDSARLREQDGRGIVIGADVPEAVAIADRLIGGDCDGAAARLELPRRRGRGVKNDLAHESLPGGLRAARADGADGRPIGDQPAGSVGGELAVHRQKEGHGRVLSEPGEFDVVPREGFPAADERGMHFGGGGLAIAVAADQSAIAEDERDLGLRPAAGEEERAVVPDRPEGRGAAVEGDGPGGGRQAARRGQGDAALGELNGPAIVIVRCGHDGGMSGCTGRETGEAVGIKSQPGGRGTGPRENYDGAAKADKGEPAESPSPDRHLHILQLYISQRKHRSPNCQPPSPPLSSSPSLCLSSCWIL